MLTESVAVRYPKTRRPNIRRARELASDARAFALLPAIVIIGVVGTFTTSGKFLTLSNLTSLGQESSELAVVVVGEALIMICGQIDISLQATYGLAPTIGVWLAIPKSAGGSSLQLNAYLAIAVIILVGTAIGAVNGLLVARVRLNAFITTLAMLILLEGVQLGIPNGKTLYQLPDPMLWLGSAVWLGIPVEIWITALIYVIGSAVLRYTYFGRSVYAVGGGAQAARAAGINDRRIVIYVFMIGGALAAFAGLMLTSTLTAVGPGQGNNVIFSVFAAAVIGGISLNGGKGNLLGALVGVLLLALITNILSLAGFQPFWIDAATGCIILLALLLARFTAGVEDQTE